MNRRLHQAIVLCACAVLPGCERASAERAQLAVKVNGTEISARQAATPQALEKVIDRELLVQQAIHAGLDRDPQVAAAIDDARRQLLAQAYLDHVAAGDAPSREAIHAFYVANPALFAERRVYRLRETRLVPAEQVPLAHLARLTRMSAGETARFDENEVQLVQADEAPLSEQEAAPLIEQFLGGRKRLELAAAEVKRLRAVASIEYAGDFKAR